MADDGTRAAVKRVLKLCKVLGLAEVTEGTSYDQPALRVRDKRFVTIKDGRTLMLPCPLEMKELLMESAPAIYYQTDHFKGWPGILVRLDVIEDEELSLRLENAWRHMAPKTLAKARDKLA
jgi:hypothetical protein